MSSLNLLWYRLLSEGLIPARLLYGDPLEGTHIAGKTGRLRIEIVSHCWAYAHLQSYQLSSLVLHPPREVDVIMTVFFSSEDELTRATLEFFAQQAVDHVQWNWQELPKQQLFRRAIGRNKAALSTEADWIWFTDCDLLFGEGCLDALGRALQGCREALVYPQEERISDLWPDEHPALAKDESPRVKSIDTAMFRPHHPRRATGPLQIVHGDVARAAGYCRQTPFFLEPVNRWAKTHEDRIFRWLINHPGHPVSVPAVYRIRHQSKGRYKAGIEGWLRKEIRNTTDKR